MLLHTPSSRHLHSLFQAVGRLFRRSASPRTSQVPASDGERQPARISLFLSMKEAAPRARRIDFSRPDGFRRQQSARRSPRTDRDALYFSACDH